MIKDHLPRYFCDAVTKTGVGHPEEIKVDTEIQDQEYHITLTEVSRATLRAIRLG